MLPKQRAKNLLFNFTAVNNSTGTIFKSSSIHSNEKLFLEWFNKNYKFSKILETKKQII